MENKLFEAVFGAFGVFDGYVFDEEMGVEMFEHMGGLGLLDKHPEFVVPAMKREVSVDAALAIQNGVVMALPGSETFDVVGGLAMEPFGGVSPGDAHKGIVVAEPIAHGLADGLYFFAKGVDGAHV